ncbi:hypothetical protein L3X38_000310 [Prunus dulcis]|uniref:Serine/threonine specific protein phosphatases domain-containing protein n=1 Tax=Prunus dulcis TaxID=3755 RepID=A0AAD4UST4_PRUDU|nr:hypothetical protein L3X38_000310 [Prunus dulcis]
MFVFDWASRNLESTQLPNVFPVEPLNTRSLSSETFTGQLHDLFFLLRDVGFPSENRFFVFNGDYVDRGAWGLESFLILLAWKVLMQRGCIYCEETMNQSIALMFMVFEKEVLIKYDDRGKHVYCKCLGCFEGLPLASLVGKQVYTAHGGLFRHMPAISKKSKGKKSRRAFNPEPSPNVIPGDVLWSDPSISPGLSQNIERETLGYFGVVIAPRIFSRIVNSN